MSERYSNANRINLPKVVEAVHRRNAVDVLGSLGITLAQDFTWEGAEKTHDAAENNGRILTFAEYEGRVPVNGVFGLDGWQLTESLPTDQIRYKSRSYEDSDTLHRHTQVGIRRGDDEARVLLMPDVPPVAIYEADIRFVMGRNIKLVKQPNDAATLAAVQRAFGVEAVDFISESAAQSLVYALLNDESRAQLGELDD